MKTVLKTNPAVFSIGNTYQIIVPVNYETVMWVKVGEKCYYDDSNGILRSAKSIHKMTVPAEELDREKQYTICYYRIIKRLPYFTKTKPLQEEVYSFNPVPMENPCAYHIADAHNMVDEPVAAAHRFCKEVGKIDFLILNGDVPEDSGKISNFDNVYQIISQITKGNIPVIFSRGNHDTRGIFAEEIADYTPTDEGRSYFTFRVGNIWGLVVDTGEDKPDNHEEYGNMVCCHNFRERETRFLEELVKKSDEEYNAPGVEKRIIVCHVPFTMKNKPPFNIEEERYTYWARLIKENIKPDIMICGHTHRFSVLEPGCPEDSFGQPCTLVVGSQVNKDTREYAGCGFTFSKNCITVHFNDDKKLLNTMEIK